jgi:hypothetical protein
MLTKIVIIVGIAKAINISNFSHPMHFSTYKQ